DEMLAASQDPGLADEDRQAVDAWLDEHPEWRPRARSYTAIGEASSEASPSMSDTSERAPAISSLSDLWANIDAEQQRRSLSPPHPSGRSEPEGGTDVPLFAPPAPSSLDAARHRRRRGAGMWLAAAAALLIVGVGSVIVVTDGGGDDEVAGEVPDPAPDQNADVAASAPDTVADDTLAAEPSPEAPTQVPDLGTSATGGPEAMARLQDSAANTTDIGTADVEYRMLATSDVTGSIIEEETGESVVTFESVGIGQLEFPDRSILTTETTTRVGERTDLLPVERGITVQDAGHTFVRCAGEADFTETAADAETACWASGINPDTFSPGAAIDAITGNQLDAAEIASLGTDTMPDGSVISGYQTIESVSLDDGQVVEVTLQIWIDGDDFIRRTVAGADFAAGESSFPTRLVMSYDLNNLGVEVDIPVLD
ncbi:MAG: hypothetical protein ACK5OX_09025, partial [Desertimonas sp.]